MRQFRIRKLGSPARAGNLGRSATVSRGFLYRKDGKPQDVIANHERCYPVLFGDGSVRVAPFPDEVIDPENPPKLWGNRPLQASV